MTEHFPPRTSKRAPIETRVRFRFANLEDFEVRQSADLSLGGMFLKGHNPPPAGTRVDFEFVLTDATELIRGTGEVVWSREEDEGPDKPSGMGIRFLKLSPGSRAIIFHAVDRWIQEGGEPFDVEQEAPDEEEVAASLSPEASEPSALTHAPEPLEAPTGDSAATETTGPPTSPAHPESFATAPLGGPDDEPEGDVSSPEPLSELVARTTDSEPRPAAPAALDPDAFAPSDTGFVDDEPGDLSSSRVGGVAYARPERSGTRWGRLIGIVGLMAVLAAAVSFVWLRDHDPSPSSTETTEPGGTAGGDTPAPILPASSDAEDATALSSPPPEESRNASALESVSEPEPAVAEPEPPPTQAVTRLEEISWQESTDGTEVVLVGDGSFELQRWTRFRLAGPNPREVVKIRGIEGPYDRSLLPVGSPELRQVRTGFHTLPGSNELHVVMDLADPGVEATDVEARGRTLRIHLTGPRG